MKAKYFLISLLAITITSCKKLIEVPAPVNTINQENVYTNDATATGVLNSVYAQMSSTVTGNGGSLYNFMTVWLGASADELTYFNPTDGQELSFYYKNALNGAVPNSVFGISYGQIFVINDVVENLQTADKLSTQVRTKLLGEAYFLRAYYYFGLVNIYGDVPLVLTTDYKVNSVITKTPQADVYKQITADLIQAKSLLSKQYLATDGVTVTPERTVPNYYAATALLARVYLYQNNYVDAEKQSSEVIAQTDLYSLPNLANAFLRNNTGAIFQLQPVNGGWNTEDAKFFIIPSSGISASNPVYLSNFLLNTFEAGDQRKTEWIGKYTNTSVTPNVDYYYPYKYKSATQKAAVTEYTMMLRLAEQYLIRAEAMAQQGRISEAKADLDVIRNRAGLPNTTASDQQSLMKAIVHERQVELFTEQGQRWLDLKRLGLLDAVMGSPGNVTAAKGGTWSSFRQLFPFPQSEIAVNPNLIQNTGY